MSTFSDKVISLTGVSVATGTAGGTVTDAIKLTPTANTLAANVLTVTNAAAGQATTLTIPDVGAATGAFVLAADATAAGAFSGITAGTAAASKAIVLGASKDIATITSATITTMTGNVVGNVTGNITGNVTGYVVGQANASQSTITAVAGASNHSTITVQIKDGAGTNMTGVTPFKVYLATSNTGLTLQSAASTGYSVTSGGVVDPTGSTTITQGLAALSSATGGCVIDLLDTAKGTGNLILVVGGSIKASAAITSGSYGA